MVKPSLRTRSIGTKVSEEEYAQMERAAQMAAKTLGERCRDLMLTSANGQPAKATRTADEFRTADGRGHPAAHRPGRLGQAEGGARKAVTSIRFKAS